MRKESLALPPHFDPDRVGQVWRVEYQKRAEEAESWAAEQEISPAGSDSFRICLLAVDVQNTFCIPEYELFVAGPSGTGAVDDNRRLCQFIYRNLDKITRIAPTLDTHQALQLFHSIFLVDDEGRHPDPLTRVSYEDIRNKRWRINPDVCGAAGITKEYGQRHLEHYTRKLNESEKLDWTIWPYHSMLGGIGHALVSAVHEAIFFHSIARSAWIDFQIKGSNPLTEHYSLFGPEVETGPDGRKLEEKNARFIQNLAEFDRVYIAGQAKSHCVAWTVQDLLSDPTARDSGLIERIYLLEDCTSPVVVPGVIDYRDEADAAFGRFVEAGMHVVQSTDLVEAGEITRQAVPGRSYL